MVNTSHVQYLVLQFDICRSLKQYLNNTFFAMLGSKVECSPFTLCVCMYSDNHDNTRQLKTVTHTFNVCVLTLTWAATSSFTALTFPDEAALWSAIFPSWNEKQHSKCHTSTVCKHISLTSDFWSSVMYMYVHTLSVLHTMRCAIPPRVCAQLHHTYVFMRVHSGTCHIS